MTDRMTTLQTFFKTLENFDWFYSFSDDHRTWAKGEKTFETLRREAHTDPTKLTMWGHWINFMNDHVAGRPAQRPELSDFGLA